MSLTRTIAHNSLYQIVGKGLSTALGLVVVKMMARYLGTEGMGYYGSVIGFTQFFGILIDLGLYIILLKRISEPGADEERITSNIFTLRLLSAILFLGCAPFVVLLFPFTAVVKSGVIIISISFVFVTLIQLLTGLFQKHYQTLKVAIAENVGRLGLLIGTIVAIALHQNLLFIFGVVLVSQFLNFLILFLFSRKLVRIRLAFDWELWKNILREAAPIAISIGFNLIYFKADTIILSLYHPGTPVGIYTVTYKVLEIIVSFPAMFAGLLLPQMTRAFANKNMEWFQTVMQRGFDTMAMVALPMIVGTWFIATPLMILLTDHNFEASGRVLQLVIVATGMIFVGNLFGNAVVAIQKQKTMLFGYMVNAAIALAGYFIFIPRYSYIGAAWTTIVAETLIMLTSITLVLVSTRIRLSLLVFGKILLSTAIMGGILWFIRDVHPMFLVGIGSVVYGGMIILTKAIERETLRKILQLRS